MNTDPLAGMTINETADLLGLSDDTVRKMVALGDLRARRVGSRWVVSRRAVEEWWDGDGVTRGNVVALRRRISPPTEEAHHA